MANTIIKPNAVNCHVGVSSRVDMPPIKGRIVAPPGGLPHTAGFRSVKQMLVVGAPGGGKRLVAAGGRGRRGTDGASRDAALLRLRIPTRICAALPSVRRFNGAGDYVDLTTTGVVKPDVKADIKYVMSGRRRRAETARYVIRPVREMTFDGLIFDVALSPRRDVAVVSCESGAFMVPVDASGAGGAAMVRLENVSLGGGVGFLSDGHIAVVCRNRDTVSIYMPQGTFLRAFPAGKCPLALAVAADDLLVVADVGSDKCLRVYRRDGQCVRVVRGGTDVAGSALRWPQYLVHRGSDLLVIDTHRQVALTFDARGTYVRTLPLLTGGGTALREPAGTCIGGAAGDLFIVDRSLGTLEVFAAADASYVQTLLTPGGAPKAVDAVGDLMIVGGTTRTVWLCSLDTLDAALDGALKPEPKAEVKLELISEVKSELATTDSTSDSTSDRGRVKAEIGGDGDATEYIIKDEFGCVRIKTEPHADDGTIDVHIID